MVVILGALQGIFFLCFAGAGHYSKRLIIVADPDLELRGRGGGGYLVLIYSPCWRFSLQSFLLFLLKIRRAPGPSPRSATVLPWVCVIQNYNKFKLNI